MKKKLGVVATLFMALFAVIQPAAAQDRNDWNRGRFEHDRGRFVYRPAPYVPAREFRDEGFRDRAFRDQVWRERELRERERERCDRYGYGYRAPGYYGR
jgi:hypothetical protein